MEFGSLKILERDNTPEEQLRNKVDVLAKSAWKDKWASDSDTLTPWLNNFNEDERLMALYLLSHFVYFDAGCIKEMLIKAYEDYVRRPIIFKIREKHNHTINETFIENEYSKMLKHVRFLCLGNPSESSALMLYFFRQENNIPLELFISVDMLFEHKEVNEEMVAILQTDDINQIIVLDDFCASGSQASKFSDKYVSYIKKKAPQIEVSYVSLVGTCTSREVLNKSKMFDKLKYCITLDETYRLYNDKSRYWGNIAEYEFCKEDVISMCGKYGNRLSPKYPNGYKDGQLMIGFFHNTPNNTIPIFWSESDGWNPIFKRYQKIYKL